MISKVKLAYGLLGFAGVSGAAIAVAVNWNKITNNETVKSIFQTFSSWMHIGGIMEHMEGEAKPLPTDLPEYTFLSSSNNRGLDKFGGKYGNVLVGKENNDAWWKWSIVKAKDIQELGDAFNGLGNKEESDFDKLKTACSNVYDKAITELKEKEEEIAWKLCSPFGTKPHNAKDIPKFHYINKFAHSNNIESEHLIADRPANKNVWEEIYKKLLKDKNEVSSDEIFSKVKSGYNTKYEEENLSLNKACEKLYSQTKDKNKSSINNLWKYCSLGGKAPEESKSV